jgi:hypothetical protein
MAKQVRVVSVLFLLLVGFLAACGATSLPGSDASQGYAPEEAPLVPGVAEEPGKADEDTVGGSGATAAAQRMIIWNAAIALTVEDATKAMDQVQSIARSLGGYSVGTESWLLDDQLHARLTIRVPADNFEAAMAQLRGLALKVIHETANSEDVTDQYVDLESRLRALKAKEEQLIKFLDSAEDTEAVLAVYEQLSATQSEIEQVKGRMAYLETLSAMATITVELTPKEAEQPIVEEGWKPLGTLRNAARSLVGTLEALAKALIWVVVYVLPVLLLVALPIVVVILIIRRWRRSRRQAAA